MRTRTQSRLEDRPFVPAIAARVEAMLREHGVSVAAAAANARSELDSDDENEGLTGVTAASSRVRLDMRS